MAKEIERKFMCANDDYKRQAIACHHIVQGYLSNNINAVIRVRVFDETGYITVKSRTRGITRDEWEYEIPVDDARDMMKLCGNRIIDKIRYIVPYEGFTWEVDVFNGKNDGIVVAEIEIPSADTEFAIPPFIANEVTGDPRYYNSALAAK